jgi:hypothetical protein
MSKPPMPSQIGMTKAEKMKMKMQEQGIKQP